MALVASDRAAQELPDELRLTQYGERPPAGDGFRDKLRAEIGETEISLILGDVDTAAASMLVAKWLSPWAIRRVTTVGHLRAVGFHVVHSPTKTNRLHVSVYASSDPAGLTEWDDELAKSFNACFTDHDAGEVTAHEPAADAGQSGVGASARNRER